MRPEKRGPWLHVEMVRNSETLSLSLEEEDYTGTSSLQLFKYFSLVNSTENHQVIL
jgi:hypothetical protein